MDSDALRKSLEKLQAELARAPRVDAESRELLRRLPALLLDDVFDDRVFVVSFLSNIVIAALLVFLGDQLGVGAQISTGVVVVLAMRIFANAAAIRRHLFKA